MTKREEYFLNFQKINVPDWGIAYHCSQIQQTNESFHLCDILNQVSNQEPESLLEEINFAINGDLFEEYYTPDGSNGGVRIVPPIATINEEFDIQLIDFRELLEEWIAFVNT